MRQHPAIGERILNADPAMRPVARLVRASHERWDGTGYPDHLAGSQIPLGARIIAACDAFEAMTSDRCYQAARTPAAAIDELRRNAVRATGPLPGGGGRRAARRRREGRAAAPGPGSGAGLIALGRGAVGILEHGGDPASCARNSVKVTIGLAGGDAVLRAARRAALSCSSPRKRSPPSTPPGSASTAAFSITTPRSRWLIDGRRSSAIAAAGLSG
jgi:hypothetical protein